LRLIVPKTYLRQNSTIQKLITVVLLTVFTLGSAPKAFFHDLVADHKDGTSCNLSHSVAAIHNQGFNCHFDDLVVSGPFVLQSEPSTELFTIFFEKKLSAFSFSYFDAFLQHKENRGPPVA